jgi:hypothetical protein
MSARIKHMLDHLTEGRDEGTLERAAKIALCPSPRAVGRSPNTPASGIPWSLA